jgi:GT2 family glycosyltransferase
VSELPTVTIVFLVYNRCEQLRTSLTEMMMQSDYPRELVDVVVVDNASGDGTSEMVREGFPEVTLIRRQENCGVSGWNDGFAVARGEYVLALDDDCYLPADGLRRAVVAARERDADLVSFAVVSSEEPGYRFDMEYRAGLLTFWGCAVLIRRPVLERIGGYDPEIFLWANEVEFMLRFYKAGFRHLYAPEIAAVHMRRVRPLWHEHLGSPAYRMNLKNIAYTAGKHLRAREAAGVLIALLVTHLYDAVVARTAAAGGIPVSVGGFLRGWRRRDRATDREISRVYRHHFMSFASPWWVSYPIPVVLGVPGALVRRALGRGRPPKRPDRWPEYYARRARYYPTCAATLEM